LFRIEAFDNSTPPLFSDTEVILWLNEAENEACIRKELLREGSSIHFTQFDVRQGVRAYDRDHRMFEIVFGNYLYKGQDAMVPWPLGMTTAAEMDALSYAWRTLPTRPTALIIYDNTLEVNCNPNADYTVHVEGYRLPVAQMAKVAVAEVLAAGTLTLTGGSSGAVSSVLVNGLDILGSAVAFNSTLSQTMIDVAAQITTNTNRYTVTANSGVLTITDLQYTGSLHNGYTVSATTTGTLTTSATNFTGGVDSFVTRPEINQIHHRFLVKWALHRGYQKPDAETLNPGKSAAALAEFEAYFGTRPDADARKMLYASTPHRNVCYA
jgi:hypothetical protein